VTGLLWLDDEHPHDKQPARHRSPDPRPAGGDADGRDDPLLDARFAGAAGALGPFGRYSILPRYRNNWAHRQTFFCHQEGHMSRLSPAGEAWLAQRWLDHVARWLKQMQGDEWKGTPTEAAMALARVAYYGDHRPRNPGGMLERVKPFIRECGWELSFGRTGRGQFVRLKRIG
jgi:hypothetical protein